jgi:hypothetical protein
MAGSQGSLKIQTYYRLIFKAIIGTEMASYGYRSYMIIKLNLFILSCGGGFTFFFLFIIHLRGFLQ